MRFSESNPQLVNADQTLSLAAMSGKAEAAERRFRHECKNLTRTLPATQIVLVNVLVIVHVHEHDSQNHFSAKNDTNFRI